jgi:deoxyribonucleoside regulator
MARLRVTSEQKREMELTAAQLHCQGKDGADIIAELRERYGVNTNDMFITRLLKKARANGIVRMVYCPPVEEQLQMQLQRKFPWLKEARVVRAGGSPEFQLQTVAHAGAEYFDSLVNSRPGLKIAFGGGNTMYALIQDLPRRNDRKMTLFPAWIVGRGPLLLEHIDPMVLLSVLREKSGPETYAHYVTVLPIEMGTSIQKYNLRLKKNETVQSVWKGMQQVDAVFASPGVMPQFGALKTVLESSGVSAKALQRSGIIGDVCYVLVDSEGERKLDWEYFLSIGADALRSMSKQHPNRRVVLVSAGQDKHEAVRAILRGKFFNVLICDDATAMYLLSDGQSLGTTPLRLDRASD